MSASENQTQPEPGSPVVQETPWQRYRFALFKHFAEEHNLTLLESQMDEIENLVGQHPEILQLRAELAEWQNAFAMVKARPALLAKQAIEDATELQDLRRQGFIEPYHQQAPLKEPVPRYPCSACSHLFLLGDLTFIDDQKLMLCADCFKNQLPPPATEQQVQVVHNPKTKNCGVC